MSDLFHIFVKRDPAKGDSVPGHIYLNGKLLGSTLERTAVKVRAGDYAGVMRYSSSKHFAQGAHGAMGQSGDFLLEISGVRGHTDILLHTGNRPKHSDGCILLGPISSTVGNDGKLHYSVGHDSPLRKLRLAYYGTDEPVMCPDRVITISIRDAS